MSLEMLRECRGNSIRRAHGITETNNEKLGAGRAAGEAAERNDSFIRRIDRVRRKERAKSQRYNEAVTAPKWKNSRFPSAFRIGELDRWEVIRIQLA